jgi:hypothetical protein
MTATRRVAAILAVDIVGYSRLIGEDRLGPVGRCASIARRRRSETALARFMPP